MGTKRYETPTATIEVIEEYCKGCAICIEFCPKKCFILENFKAVVINDDCTGCEICEKLCPDFGLKIYRKQKAKE